MSYFYTDITTYYFWVILVYTESFMISNVHEYTKKPNLVQQVKYFKQVSSLF